MVFEILGDIGLTTTFIIVIFFILFVVIFKKFLGFIKNLIIIAVASVLFPIVARFMGLNVPTDSDTILSFLLLGIGLYILYVIVNFLYKILKKFGGGGGKKTVIKKEPMITKEVKEMKKPFVLGQKTKTNWEKDYVTIEDRTVKTAKPETKEKKAGKTETSKKKKRKSKNVEMEKIPVIGED